MHVVLSIYSEKAFKEFVMPFSLNIETAISVRGDVFGLPEDLDLAMENIDGKWRFTANSQVQILKSGQPYGQQFLEDGDYFQCLMHGRRTLAIMVHITQDRFAGYQKYALAQGSVSIGTLPECALCYSFEYAGAQYITKRHAVITTVPGGLMLTDSSRNGVFVNDLRVKGSVSLQFGDRIDIWGLNIVALGNVLAIRSNPNLKLDSSQLCLAEVPDAPITDGNTGKVKYHRSPRTLGRLISGTVEIEAPPSPQNAAEPPMFMTVGPALTMALPMVAGSGMAIMGASTGGMYMYAGLVTAVLSAISGAIWAIVNIRYSRKQAKAQENHRFSAYSDYLLRTTEEIRNAYEHNIQTLRDTYPPAEQCLASGRQGEHLWERNVNHPDFLAYRLGQGDVPFQVEIKIPGEKFEMIDDSLRDKPRVIQENYKTLHDVPVCVDLQKEHIVGLVGGPTKAGARAILRTLVAQIAALNCYTDVKLAFIYHEDQGDDSNNWSYCRWLPHTWSEGRKARFIAANKAEASDVFYEIASVLRVRSEMQAQHSAEPEVHKPWYILVIEDSAVLENEPIAKYILDTKQDLGLTTLLLANTPEDLPNACECIIRRDDKFCGMYHTQEEEREVGRLAPDSVNGDALEQFARHLSNIEVNEIEIGGEIPNSITFFDMHGITRLHELHVEERWKKSRTYENMRALIGQKSGNLPCYLNVHEKYHGPHGLLAGTTGSGKSETLQTYILSLVINFSPYDVGLFIIDYKGGGMANLFNGLPHMLGQISNLSGGQVHRAMASIKSENMRRQRIFNEHGVNNINLYTNLFKNGEATIPVPHLFIVIDEFAELKREQPDFMRELISVAQVGRSLGVHLILATQKPSGTVDDNIWSNSKFRICLRVQDRQDSLDMLHKADAAYLTQAGRGYLQVGSDEVFEQFQSGWSGAVYDEDTAGSKQVLAKMLTNTGKTALVGSYAKRRQTEKLHLQWLEQLAECLDIVSISNAETADGENGDMLICTGAYEIFRDKKIDYAESDYNTRALMRLLQLVRGAKAAGIAQQNRAAWIHEKAAAEHIKLPERKEKTQLDAVVEYLAVVAADEGYQTLPSLWLAPLPEALYLEDIEGWKENSFQNGSWPAHDRKWELSALMGKSDDPANQAQMPMEINFTRGGHHALIASASSGKSTFVQTLLYSLIHRYSPDYLNLYVLDFSSRMSMPFENAAHVGGIVYENDLERVGKLFYLLQEMVAERKRLFGGGSYNQYVMVNGQVCPAVLVVIDGIANFREKTGEMYDDILVRLAREGITYGIYLFITGASFGLNEIFGRLADQIRTTLTLTLSDIYQYAEALRGPQPSVFPETGVQGRGLSIVDGITLEYQTALCNKAEDDYGRAEQITNDCFKLNQAWSGKFARQIPSIPENPQWFDIMERSETTELLENPRYLPIGYEYVTAGIYSLDLSRTYCYTITGRPRTGKTSLLRLMMRMANAKGARVVVLENGGISLQSEAVQLGVEYYASLDEIIGFIGEMAETFRARNALKGELIAQGLEEDAQFERMSQERPWFIFIADLPDFVEMVYTPEAQERNLNGALENLIGKGFLHNIYFISAMEQDARMRVMGMEVYEFFVKDLNGIHLGGNVAAQQLFDFGSMPFKDQGIAEKPGVGLVPPHDGEPYLRIILPQAKG